MNIESVSAKAATIMDIRIVSAKLEADKSRHLDAKKVLANFEIITITKGNDLQTRVLEYKSPFIPSSGQSLVMFQAGTKYRFFLNDDSFIELKPCINAVPLKEPNKKSKPKAKNAAASL